MVVRRRFALAKGQGRRSQPMSHFKGRLETNCHFSSGNCAILLGGLLYRMLRSDALLLVLVMQLCAMFPTRATEYFDAFGRLT
jgi:hypothetical protein